jgi:hypothetical protein
VKARITTIFLMLLMVAEAGAAVTARIDRSGVDLNESFTLELVVDGNIDVEPDISVLEKDFYIGQTSQLSNTSIINGQISRSRTWTYMLMAKSTGEIVIPPIPVGKQQGNSVTISVREPSYAPPGEADVFVDSLVDFDETYVQAQILYTIKIYRAVATRQPSLREPEITGAEVLVELAGDERSYEAVLDGKPYNVVERVIAIYPQESGEIQISPARFEARVLRNGRITGRKVFQSDSHTVNILPTPPPPGDYPDAVWLPARDVTINEEWSRDVSEIIAGQPLTRRLQVSALGQLETQIPAVDLPSVAGLNVYPDKPELRRLIEPDGIRGVREDQFALIGVNAGDIELPAFELPWWDIEAGEWRVATLPAKTITILPSGDEPAPVAQAEPVADAEAPPVTAAVAPAATSDTLWRRVAELLGALWVITLLLWWWSSRPAGRQPREPAPVPLHRQQAKYLKAARKAALEGDKSGVKEALLGWARMQWPDNTPRSVGSIAERVSDPLSSELRNLSSASYGAAGAAWDGSSLAKALRSFAVLSDENMQQQEKLPPLMPVNRIN